MKPLARGMSAAVIIAISAAGGCVPQTNIPIVSEKTGETSEMQEQLWENTEDGMEKSMEENDSQMNTIRAQAEVPEMYRTDIQGENITITAAANVEMPETDRLPQMEIEYLPYTDKELEKMKEILEQELGIEAWEEKSGDGPRIYESLDHVYNLSLGAGKGQETPMVWLLCPGISDGSGQKGNLDDLPLSPAKEEERKKVQAEVEEKAENLLRKMGLEDFCLEEVRWSHLSVSQNYSWSPSGEQGIRLYYWRRAEDIPVISRGKKDGTWGERAHYVEFLYKEDATLLEVKNIGREQVTGISGYAKFLIPFLSVSQIFEQCMKTAQADGHGTDMGEDVLRQENSTLTEGYPDAKPHIYLTVTEVKLVYRAEYENQDSAETRIREKKGKLIPVWAFYGITERGYQDQNGVETDIPRTLLSRGQIGLLMVNAEDGTIYWR